MAARAASAVPRRRRVMHARGRTAPADMRLSLNTHAYDGMLLDYAELVAKDDAMLVAPKSFDDTLEEILYVLEHMTMEFYEEGHPEYKDPEVLKRHVRSFVAYMRSERGRHLDPTDEIDSQDLLPRVWRFVRKYHLSAAELFYEQLAAIMWSGRCRQGRSKRLIQFYVHHMLDEDKVFQLCMLSPD